MVEYEEIKKTPYIFGYLKLDKMTDIPTISEQGKVVDSYIKGVIERLHLDNSFKAYEGILKDLEKSIGLNPNATSDYRLQKIARWIEQVLLPQQKIDLLKESIQNG